ncbi:methylated-DNA--[protein]-cysteine S-methyltransferase [Belnapia rosea]|uniref:Methylated-DNA--protein-cysteine methyltransferase n=1 Tax=Belnapia rosea TaxID=938405 RepID=A0A1G6QFZ0_9PROT|nr:methylated-DNA--[protein]-cysteine S-methyltransferase [Belnapia rosea]SDB64603.1 methylated-DNA-[protein]-cysteine S-methyltransferase [Belnapia rosea]SDC91390.1 methylated-DNA-[protein]-cysteine S-methyltransferase [Belnapia rosea]
MPHLTLHTPLGELTVFEEDGAIIALEWGRAYGSENAPPTASLREAAEQLHDYFDGRRSHFDLPVAPQGSAFRQSVWAALCRIPPGETRSYSEIAAEIGCRSPRAIGQANGANPIPIIIPCHRVVAAKGAIGGYSGEGGIATKRFLLALEARGVSREEAGTLPLSRFSLRPPAAPQGTPR